MTSYLNTINKGISIAIGLLFKKKGSTKGSYVLEASIILPMLVIALALLISAIPVISAGEKALYVMFDEIRFAGIRAAFVQEPASLPALVSYRISLDQQGNVVSRISDYDYLHESMGIQDLISMEVESGFSGINPMGGVSVFKSNQRAVGRAFTGKDGSGDHGMDALNDDEASHIVYVFPSRGTRYHNRSCSFLNPACQKVFLTKETRRKFKSCPNCKSESANIGTQVFCFFNEGRAYHLGSCSSVDKYFVEMEKKDAERKGYAPCMTCGG